MTLSSTGRPMTGRGRLRSALGRALDAVWPFGRPHTLRWIFALFLVVAACSSSGERLSACDLFEPSEVSSLLESPDIVERSLFPNGCVWATPGSPLSLRVTISGDTGSSIAGNGIGFSMPSVAPSTWVHVTLLTPAQPTSEDADVLRSIEILVREQIASRERGG